jgi:hypothetical protein
MGVVGFFSERFLFCLPGETFLLPRANCYPQAARRSLRLHYDVFGSGRGTSTLNLQSGLFFLPSGGGESAPFQSLSLKVRERIFSWAELLSWVGRQGLFYEQPEFGGLDASGGYPPEIDG